MNAVRYKYFDNKRIELDRKFHEKAKVLVDIVKIIGCKKCGKCCELTARPALSYAEICHFSKDVDIVLDDVTHSYALPYPCPFFDRDKRICKTEMYKPFTCRMFPFSTGEEKVGGLSIVLCKTGKVISTIYKRYLIDTKRKPRIGENAAIVMYENICLDYMGAIPFDMNFDNLENFCQLIKKMNKITKKQ